MFSDRASWDVSPNRLSRLLEKKKAAGETVFDLTESNPTRAGFLYEDKKILTALARPPALLYEPAPRVLETARKAVRDYYRKSGREFDPDSIFLTASTSEAYSLLFKLLGNADDEILIPRPGYPLLSFLAVFEELRPVSYPLKYDPEQGWFIDIEILENLIHPCTRAIAVVSPNNPTGSYLKKRELSKLDALCRRHDLALIIDEVFCDYPAVSGFKPDPAAVDSAGCLTFVLNGLSKIAGLPQMKLGWTIVRGKADLAAAARSRLETLIDFYLSVSTPVQHAAADFLGSRHAMQKQIVSRLEENSRFLQTQLAHIQNCKLLQREGGWYAILEITDTVSDEERALQLLEEDDTLVHPGYFYDFDREGFVVMSLLTPVKPFQTGVSRLLKRYGR